MPKAYADTCAFSPTYVFLSRMAAREGKTLVDRVHVTTFEAACHIIAANLAIGILPWSVARTYASALGLRVIALTDNWARRQIIICMRDYDSLLVPARAFVDHLLEQSEGRKNQGT
jgi:DNA-binding transcriptional LysR family regulator